MGSCPLCLIELLVITVVDIQKFNIRRDYDGLYDDLHSHLSCLISTYPTARHVHISTRNRIKSWVK